METVIAPSLSTIFGIILLLGVLGLLKPIRNFTTSLGNDVDTLNDVKNRAVKEWDVDSAINHAKKMSKVMLKAQALKEENEGAIHTYEEVMTLLRTSRAEE